jgi:hypothetical protein
MKDAVTRWSYYRFRGVSPLKMIALLCLSCLVIGVYLMKAGAEREAARISALDRNIYAEERDVRRLRETVARLEQPARIEAMSEHYLGLKPVRLKQELKASDLPIVLAAPTAQAAPGQETQR